MTDDCTPTTETEPEECEWCRGFDVVYACAHCDRDDTAKPLDREEPMKRLDYPEDWRDG